MILIGEAVISRQVCNVFDDFFDQLLIGGDVAIKNQSQAGYIFEIVYSIV
jgi:hypothetical protein